MPLPPAASSSPRPPLTLSAASYTRAADKPNEKVRVAVMGLRIRGKQLAPAFAAHARRRDHAPHRPRPGDGQAGHSTR